MRVEPGQVWRHVASGDVRTVLAVLTYRERTGFEPRERELAHGMTHIAAMGMDCRDSSDMVLVEGRPAHPSSWELLSHWCPQNRDDERAEYCFCGIHHGPPMVPDPRLAWRHERYCPHGKRAD